VVPTLGSDLNLPLSMHPHHRGLYIPFVFVSFIGCGQFSLFLLFSTFQIFWAFISQPIEPHPLGSSKSFSTPHLKGYLILCRLPLHGWFWNYIIFVITSFHYFCHGFKFLKFLTWFHSNIFALNSNLFMASNQDPIIPKLN